jgi:hypothetical protein
MRITPLSGLSRDPRQRSLSPLDRINLHNPHIWRLSRPLLQLERLLWSHSTRLCFSRRPLDPTTTLISASLRAAVLVRASFSVGAVVLRVGAVGITHGSPCHRASHKYKQSPQRVITKFLAEWLNSAHQEEKLY